MSLPAWRRRTAIIPWFRNALVLTAAILSVTCVCWAQLPSAGDTTSPPTPGVGHDYIHSPVETVNPANGSVSIRIPIRIPEGRELTIPLNIAYDSNGAFYFGGPGAPRYMSSSTASLSAVPFSQGGWSYTFPSITASTDSWSKQFSGTMTATCEEVTGYVFQDSTGDRHNLGLLGVFTITHSAPTGVCGPSGTQGGEGPILATINAAPSGFSVTPPVVTDGNGTVYSFSGLSAPPGITDRNGNTISISESGSGTTSTASLTDTLGRTVSVGSFGANPDSINVSGLASPYQVSWTTVSPSFPISVVNTGVAGTQNCPTSLTGSANVVSQIVLPNGQKYAFAYDPTYGMLSKVTYPSGGYVRYVWGLNHLAEAGDWSSTVSGTTDVWSCQYDFPAITDRYVSLDGSTETLHQQFSYSTNFPSGSNTYTSKTTKVTTTVNGTSFNTVYSYLPVTTPPIPHAHLTPNINTQQMPVEQCIEYYDASGTGGTPPSPCPNLSPGGKLLKTVIKSWANAFPPVLSSAQTTLDNGQSSLVVNCYNSSEEVTETDEYDLGTTTITPPSCSSNVPSGAVAGSLLRRAVTSYASFTGVHIVDLPSSAITYDGGGNRMAETDSSYDQTTPQAQSPVPVQHTSAPGGAARGNLTTVTKDCFIGSTTCASGNSTTTYTYYDTGQINQMTDPNNHITTYSYTDSDTSCGGSPPPSGATNAYLTQVIFPQTGTVSHIESYCYGYLAGVLRGSTDENGQTTIYNYESSALSLARLTQATYPDGGETLVSYNDTPPMPSVTTQKKLDSSRFITSVGITNGMGQPIETELTSDPQGTDLTVTGYDGLGRVQTVTNPYRTTSDPTYGVTTYSYDALDRTTSVVEADGSVVSTVYSGPCATVTDEASHSRKSCVDGLGRMTSVIEDPGSSPHLNYTTTYGYDALDNLLSVLQNGSRPRNFTYDSLSRLTQAVNPESGTMNYAYDADGNLTSKTAPAPNQTGTNTVTTTYSYDALNRLTEKQYNDGTTPTVYFNYDGATQAPNCTASTTDSNPIGQRTGMCDAKGSEAWSHDTMGRTLTDQRTTVAGTTLTQTFGYLYNLAGSVTNLAYPSGLSLTYTYDGAGRPANVKDQNGNTYAAGSCGTAGVCYTAAGATQTATLDATANFAGFTVANSYNPRLQPSELKITGGGSTFMDYSYCFYALASGACPATGTTDNGNVMAIFDGVTSTRSQTFSYDPLNRLSTGASLATSGTNCWGEQYGYDAWGNLLSMGSLAGYSACALPDNLSVGVTTANQISGYTYDAAGNLDTIPGTGGSSYTYNAENQMTTSTAGVIYTYDGDGKRLKKSSGAVYWYGMTSDPLEETNPTGGLQNDYVFFGGQRIARLDASGDIFAYFEDHLGSSRKMRKIAPGATTSTAAYDADFYPFGREQVFTNGSPIYKFTGKIRDTETGLDDFDARYYSSTIGRFMIPDWAAKPTSVPYAEFGDPQTLNLYSYVRNNPLSQADVDGHGFWQKLKNWFEYGHSVNDTDLEKALANDPQQMASARAFLRSHNPNITDAQLNSASNKEILDAVNQIELSDAEGAPALTALGLIYDAAPYHGESQNGRKSAGPRNGQEALDNSVQVKDTSPRRVGVDKQNGEIVVFDQTSPGVFHGHVRTWSELTSQMQNALVEAGLTNARGTIIK